MNRALTLATVTLLLTAACGKVGRGSAPAQSGGTGAASGSSGATSGNSGGLESAGGVSDAGSAGAAIDPCLGVSCDTPPPSKCKDATTSTSYAPHGTCTGGSCVYAPTDTGCGAKQCSGAGVCASCQASDASCGPGCAPCAAPAPKCKAEGATSQCVACLSDADCGADTPSCNTATNLCEALAPPPSCVGLAKTCGPSGDADCCASGQVTAGTFNRSNDAKYPATLSAFRLDKYEISVGRFRKFVAAYTQAIIPAGAGKNPNNPKDTGWNAAWNASLAGDVSTLQAGLKCGPSYQTWTDSVASAEQESLPIACLDWYEAEAFCIWDDARLPTEAEWNYAAAGGDEQRAYPWGNGPPDCSTANFHGGPAGFCVSPPTGAANRVGSESPKGDGRFGQSDLAGNVWEWVQDYSTVYANPCQDCAALSGSANRVLRGGNFYLVGYDLLSSNRNEDLPTSRAPSPGARCARTP